MSRLPQSNRLQVENHGQNSDYLPELIRNTEETIHAVGGTVILLKKKSVNSSEIDFKGTSSVRGPMNNRVDDDQHRPGIETKYWRPILGIPALIELSGQSEKQLGRSSGGNATVTIARATLDKLRLTINMISDNFLIHDDRYRITRVENDTLVLDNWTARIYSVEKI